MVILYFDNRYFKWAPLLVESIAINEPTERIVVFGLNLLPSQRREISSCRNVKFFIEMKMGASVETIPDRSRKNGAAAFLLGKKAWYVRRAFKLFPEEKMFILMDVDTLLLRPLTDLKRSMRNHDMAGAFAEGVSSDGVESIKISGGFTAFKPTKAVRRLMKEWDAFLSTGPYYWNKDQPSLAMLYRRHEKSIRFLDIAREDYLDPSLKEDSVVWSAHKSRHGPKVERHKTYLEKLRRMRKKKRG